MAHITTIARFVAALFAVALAGCGGVSVGEACDTPGALDQCESNEVCDSDSKLGVVCMQICTDDAAICSASEACSGVTGGSVKACHSK
jgi:hypothetical protein